MAWADQLHVLFFKKCSTKINMYIPAQKSLTFIYCWWNILPICSKPSMINWETAGHMLLRFLTANIVFLQKESDAELEKKQFSVFYSVYFLIYNIQHFLLNSLLIFSGWSVGFGISWCTLFKQRSCTKQETRYL